MEPYKKIFDPVWGGFEYASDWICSYLEKPNWILVLADKERHFVEYYKKMPIRSLPTLSIQVSLLPLLIVELLPQIKRRPLCQQYIKAEK